MKKWTAAILLLLVLAGCSSGESGVDRSMALRREILSGAGCSFDGVITADYGDKVCSFTMACKGNSKGDLEFTVREPETISGITGRISGEKGSFTFDDTILYYPLLADGLLSPVSAPWIFLKALRAGYITSAGKEGELFRLTMDDRFGEEKVQLDVWLDSDNYPLRGEILWQGKKYLSLEVKNFQIE